ncbi:MAG: glycosyltransferase family 39 protein [Endomicrobia bacterium]|nr:glycosyltransferase family 39 protein [Endomicrobiia bacterium]MDW8055623.1 glycosyltransferase family 39 protein [Elusimicrobiota bacterium]
MKRNKLIFIIVVVGIILRVVFCLFTPTKMDLDPQYYYQTAMELCYHREHISIPLKPPFYSIFLAMLFCIFGPSIILVQIAQCFLEGLTIYLVYFIARKIFSLEPVALLASVITAVDPFLIYFTNDVMAETLSAFLVSTISYFLILSTDGELWSAIVAGCLIGLSVLTRGNFAGYLVFVCLLGLIYYIVNKKLRFGIYNLLAITIPALLIVSLWLYRNYRIYNEIVLAYQRGVLWQGLNPNFETFEGNKAWDKQIEDEIKGMDLIQSDRYAWKKGLEYIKQYPEKFLYVYVKKILKFWRPVPYYGYSKKEKIISFAFFTPVLVLFISGLFLTARFAGKLWPLYAFILNFTLFTALMWVQLRYRVPLHPVLHVFAGYTLWYVVDRLIKKFGWKFNV